MAHSAIANAGQKYASARKRGLGKDQLEGLRALLGNHGQKPNPKARDLAEIKKEIDLANRRARGAR